MRDPLLDQGRALLGRRIRVTLQNANAQNKKPKFHGVDRVKAPAEGQAGATRRCRRVPHKCWAFALCKGLFYVLKLKHTPVGD